MEKNKAAVPLGELELKQRAAAPFFAPNDPVVLVSGLGRSTAYEPAGTLECRVPGQLLDSLQVDAPTPKTYRTGTAGPGEVSLEPPALADPNRLLPDGVAALLAEGIFLSPKLFAANVPGLHGQADAVRDAIKAAADAKPDASTRFPPPEYARPEWRQPWIPLLMEWQVTVLQDPAYDCPTPSDEGVSYPINRPPCTLKQDAWRFDGTQYVWNGGKLDEANLEGLTLTGRTFVTPQLPATLARRLDDYVRTHQSRDPGLADQIKALDDYIDGLAKMDILSQRLGGMMAKLVERDYAGNVSPACDPAIKDLIGSHYRGFPLPDPGPQFDPSEPPPFNYAPARGTFFVINQLSVVDSFGRRVDLLPANDNAASFDGEEYTVKGPLPAVKARRYGRRTAAGRRRVPDAARLRDPAGPPGGARCPARLHPALE